MTFKPGKELVIADTLSRDYPEENSLELREEIFKTQSELEEVDFKRDMPIRTDTFFKLIQTSTKECQEMEELKKVILQGWPGNKKLLHESVRKYFNERDELVEQDGLIFKG